MASDYKAGLHNIGKDEVNYRKSVVGYGSAAVAIALYFMLAFFDVPILVYAIMLVPVFISVHGFRESKNKFCTGYARAGRYNMASEVGMTQNVISRSNRDKDKKHADKLVKQSLAKSLVVTALLVVLSKFIN